jgi:hypothetical protein
VHKFITMGTLEEKIDGMLESKRDLADRVVGTGEGWLTELDDDALRRLVSLEPDADIMGDEELAGNGNGNGGGPAPAPDEDITQEEMEDILPAKAKAPLKRKPKPALRKGVLS